MSAFVRTCPQRIALWGLVRMERDCYTVGAQVQNALLTWLSSEKEEYGRKRTAFAETPSAYTKNRLRANDWSRELSGGVTTKPSRRIGLDRAAAPLLYAEIAQRQGIPRPRPFRRHS